MVSRSDTQVLPRRYANARRIGIGGMGEILLADDTTLDRPVVLKLLSEDYARDESLRRRFLREANAAARLSGHPHVVTVYDVGEQDGRPFISMEYLENGDLRSLLAHGLPDRAEALRLVEQAASALDAAHRSGVVHRDVKPANLLLDSRRDLRVADFGIARVVDEATSTMTLAGMVLGTAGYISPEQARGEPAAAASDNYSLAAVAFELLTGSRPFAREVDTDEIAAHVNDPPPHASTAGLPPAVDGVFARALAKQPQDRYPTAAAFAADLAAALRPAAPAVVMAGAPAAAHRARTIYASRRRKAIRLAVAAALALLAGLAGAYALTGWAGSGETAPGELIRTVRSTVTQQGTTVVQTETVTVTQPASGKPETGAATPLPTGDGHTLNDRGYALMRAGDYAAALPLLRAAVRDLRGAGPADPYEAYANYNLGYSLLRLGRCDQALGPLWRARRLESSPLVPRAIDRARACAAG
jgi:eukaryotic-like serine/threonine-protein kinase